MPRLLIRSTSLALASVLLAGTITGCRAASSAGDARASGSHCDPEGPGTLRVANSSGRFLDVYVVRSASTPQLLTQISLGTSSVTVRGPNDLGVRYDVIDPNARQRLASVNWVRRTAREISADVVVELLCFATAPP